MCMQGAKIAADDVSVTIARNASPPVAETVYGITSVFILVNSIKLFFFRILNLLCNDYQ